MNENDKIETDELITLYLDGEASVRQQTELKRLMQHDPSISERMEALRRQQQMLNSLPLETAPAGLLENIRCEMERKLILGDFSELPRSFWAISHLFARRLIAVAAMVLLPLGLLALVVFQIVKPPSVGPSDYVPASRMIANTEPLTKPSAPSGIFRELPFDAVLALKTDQYMAVSRAIEKVIFEQGLLSRTLPSRTADTTSFDIMASPGKVAELVTALEAIRPQCQSITLQIIGDSTQKPIEIPDPQTKQMKMLVYENSPELLHRLASRYAAANQKGGTEFARNQEEPPLEPDGYPQPSIPELAGNYDAINQMNRTVRLVIHIERNTK